MATTFTVKPDYEDYKSANWLIFRKAWLSTRTLKIPLILIVVFSAINLVSYCLRCGWNADVLWWAIRESLPVAIGATLGAGGFCALSLALQCRKIFRQLGTVDQAVEFTFSETGLSAICETGSSNLVWKHLSDFLLSKRMLILRRTAAMIYLIPLHQLDPGIIDETVSLIRSGGVKQR